MRHLRTVGLAVLALVAVASAASAQRTNTRPRAAASSTEGTWEFGGDAGISIGMDTPKSLSINIPIGMVRAGYFISDVFSLEPGLTFSSFAAKGITGQSFWRLQLGALYHLTPDRTKQQMFVHPLLAFTGGSGGARTLTSLGVGVGMKNPMFGNRLATRGEVNLFHTLKSGVIPASTNINLLFGLSVFTK